LKAIYTLNSFDWGWEDTEKSPYYWKHRHETWVKAQQKQSEALNAQIATIYLFLIQVARIVAVCLLWLLYVYVYVWFWTINFAMNKAIKLYKLVVHLLKK